MAEVVGLELPTRVRKVQYSGMTETYTAVLESEEVDTGALVRIDVIIVKVTVFEPGEEKQ